MAVGMMQSLGEPLGQRDRPCPLETSVFDDDLVQRSSLQEFQRHEQPSRRFVQADVVDDDDAWMGQRGGGPS